LPLASTLLCSPCTCSSGCVLDNVFDKDFEVSNSSIIIYQQHADLFFLYRKLERVNPFVISLID